MRAAVVALADLGRSARMRYHARALASQGVDVDLVGFEGTPLPKAIAEDGRCTLMATDLELGIRLEVRGLKVEEPGEAILPAARMLAILRESQDEELAIEADANSCQVRSANAPQALAAVRNTALALLRLEGEPNIAAAMRSLAAHAEGALRLVGVTIFRE